MKAATSLLAVLLMLSCTLLARTAPVQETARTQQAAPAQQAAAGGESSKPEAARPESESQAEAGAAGPEAASAASLAPVFAPGAKVFLEPMDGFEQFLSDAITKKKVPVVVVNERGKADFVVSGEAHVKRPGWFSGMVMSTHGKGNVSIKDARTGNVVFAHQFKKVDQMEAEGFIYQHWADQCAAHLKKAMEKK